MSQEENWIINFRHLEKEKEKGTISLRRREFIYQKSYILLIYCLGIKWGSWIYRELLLGGYIEVIDLVIVNIKLIPGLTG